MCRVYMCNSNIFKVEPPAAGGYAGCGRSPQLLCEFFVIVLGETRYFNGIRLKFRTCSEPYLEARFLTFESKLKQ